MIDVQRLRVLRAVAEHGSFNKAAGALLLTPSAVSQHIAALERTLGHPVAVRSTRGVTLTEPGRLLVETAETISDELEQVRRRIDRLGSPRPRLTLATFTSGGRHLLPAALTRFVAAWPEVELTVLEAEPEEAVAMVRRGAADLALAYRFDAPAVAGSGARPALDWTPLMDDPLSVVLPRGHRFADRASLGLRELAAERWVLGCMKTEAYLRRYAAQAGFELRVAASSTDYFFAQSLVAAGVGVSLVPRISLAPGPGAVAVEVEPPRPARYIGVIAVRRRAPQPYVEALTGELVAEAGAQADAGEGGRPDAAAAGAVDPAPAAAHTVSVRE
ncbi:LysR family transcriptional regulator [Streptomyces sp. NBC_00536]|uniref:LysR family transcriptional regulator n=1 Tax=Streptomyces sp. NBC_00536 TaxID=2975769 RepID=UPI002E81490A|nr:LysR family transcriptional regulator [Streptomyces sp. NBC_00536]WUC77641.1 LysR family transcriptional regulator [Streptomyces sp. NBC_00536]